MNFADSLAEGLDQSTPHPVPRAAKPDTTRGADDQLHVGPSRAAVPRAPLKALNVLALAAHEFPKRVPLLGPLIHAGDLAMWFAGRGVGKTQVMLSLSTALAFGGQFLRWKAAAPVGVLFLDGEMSGQVMQERILTFLPENAPEGLADNLQLFTPDLLELGQPLPDLSTAAGQAMVEPLIAESTRVIVIDNLSAWCRTGKENESESWTPMNNWLMTLRRRGIAVLLVHHAGKNGEQRGNSKKEDPLDLVVQLRRAGDYDAKAGAAFEDAVALVEAGKHREAADIFARIATDAPGGYRVLSRMREATETGMQDAKAAVAAFDAVAADTSVRPVLRDMAALRAAFLLLDTAPYSEIQARLEPRAAAGQAVRHSAREILALSAWRANDSGASRRWAEMIVNDGETPASIRARIEILLAVLPPQAKG